MPYGSKFIDLDIPQKNLNKIKLQEEPPSLANEIEEIKKSIRNPIKKPALSQIVDSKGRVAIIVDDITRPTPSYKIIPTILNELHVSNEKIRIVIATGLHRANTPEELNLLLGGKVLKKIKTFNHNAFDKNSLVYVGKTSIGTKLEINKLVKNADITISIGHIEPHEFAGFTGGRKSILPGVAGLDSINQNHGIMHLNHPKAKIGFLEGNPIHEDMVESANMAGLDFIVNVILNSRKEITKVVSGSPIEAHIKGVEYYRKYYQVKIGDPADIVVVSSGYPGDINLYQSIKSTIVPAEPFVKKGGIVISLVECKEGIGTPLFREFMTSFSSRNNIMERIKKEGYRAEIDHCYLLYRVLNKSDVFVVSSHESIHKINRSLIKSYLSPKEALEVAFKIKGKDAKIFTLPYAQRLVPKS